MRAPISIYSEAARLSYESYTGSSLYYTGGDDIEYSAEVFVGEAAGEEVTNERMLGLVLIANTDNIRAQVSFNSSIMNFNAFDPGNAGQVVMNGNTMNNFALGLNAEYDIATVMAEYSNTTMSGSQNLENTGWYITALRRFDQWTPHFTYQSYEGMAGNDETSFILGLNRQLDVSTVLKFELQSIDPTNGGFFEEQPDDSTVNLFSISLSMVF